VADRGAVFRFEPMPRRSARAAGGAGAGRVAASPRLVAPMPGVVASIIAHDGAVVAAGDPILAVEAMKMEHWIRAAVPGRVSLRVALGDHVTLGQLVAEIKGNS
jgi:acetyl-CoA/propionyl-CoA carboxylase biotin carboxyl carrier protein